MFYNSECLKSWEWANWEYLDICLTNLEIWKDIYEGEKPLVWSYLIIRVDQSISFWPLYCNLENVTLLQYFPFPNSVTGTCRQGRDKVGPCGWRVSTGHFLISHPAGNLQDWTLKATLELHRIGGERDVIWSESWWGNLNDQECQERG